MGEKLKNKLWPVIWCCNECIYIAVSKSPIKIVNGKREKVSEKHWTKENSNWRSDKHFIDFSKCKSGDLVKCNYCGGVVDFRLFISCSLPEFKCDKTNPIN